MRAASSTLYAIIVGGYGRLPHGELRGILDAEAGPGHYRVLYEYDSVVVFKAPLGAERARIVTDRAGLIREVGLLLAVTEDDVSSIIEAIEETDLRGLVREPVRVEVSKFAGAAGHVGSVELARLVAKILERRGLRASPRGAGVLRIHFTEGVAIIGVRLGLLDTKSFASRRPRRRPFFKPGPLDPQLTRALVNLSRLRRGKSVFLDPFCGTGGFVLEACLIGAGRCVCGDIDPVMVNGAAINLDYYKCHNSLVVHHDAVRPPLAPASVDSISTDPPYGRSTTLAKRRRGELYEAFVWAAAEVLAPGGWVVYAGPNDMDLAGLASGAGLRIVDYMEMYVHSSLTRGIVVAVKG